MNKKYQPYIHWGIGIIIGWFLFAFLLPTLFLPNQMIFKTEIEKSSELQEFAEQFKSENKEQTLKNIFEFIINNHEGVDKRYKLINYPQHFNSNMDKLLNQSFLACHQNNLMFITLAINTGQFSEEDFQRKQTIARFLTSHQYIIVNVNSKQIKVDPFFKIFKEI